MTPIARLRALVRNWVGYYLPRGRDLDLEQAYVRLGIAVLVLLYTGYVVWNEGWSTNLFVAVVAVGGLAVFAIAQIVLINQGFGHRTKWRVAAIVADTVAATVGMGVSGEAGVPMIGVYLWVTVGNGFRFGPRYLIVSYFICLAGTASLMLFAPFWREHRMIGAGLFLALGVVPLYVLILLSRLQAQRDSAEQLSNAKSRFVANVSHELRTPLTGVYAVYDLLRTHKLAPDERELVGMLGKSIATLKTSVDAILQMSKLEAGAEQAELRPFNLWYLLHQLAAIVEPQSVAKGLTFQVHVDPDVPPTVQGDPDHLSHILGNLLNNAFKFTHSGSVTLRALFTTEDRVRFEVIDTGIGIPLDRQEHLFERFVQVDNSATRRYGGTGLGTSIAHDLVQLLGGQIGVVSAPSKGSTFWVELPTPQVDDASDLRLGARSSILVVGPPSDERTRFCALLRAVGANPIEADRTLRPPEADLFAIALVMDLSEAATYATVASRAGWQVTCPWFTVARGYTSLQKTTLLRAGASALLRTDLDLRILRNTLSGLTYRIAQPEASEQTAIPVIPTGGVVRQLKILLADDNTGNRLLLAKILTDAGHSVIQSSRGDQAFEYMASGEVDLALLDLNMPEMTGPDVVKIFRASEVGSGEKLPIIILSADATTAAKHDSIEAGANEFLTKPVVAALLLDAIDRVCAGAIVRPQTLPSRNKEIWTTLVDADRLVSLRQISRGDSRFLENYISAAFADLEQGVESLRSAIDRRDERAARDALHVLEGTGASLGATALLENCKSIREKFREHVSDDLAADLAALATTQTLTKSAVLTALSSAVA